MKSSTQKLISLLGVSALTFACGSDPQPPPEVPTAPPGAPVAQGSEGQKPGDDPSQSNINIDDAIRKACGLTDTEANFAFNSSNIQQGDHDVLGKLATCFISGPLKGKSMRLVGHADNRGESEYNLVLGGKRADNVRGFLAQKGLPKTQAESTSRGEMDSTGTDEASWSRDRRVDIVLAN